MFKEVKRFYFSNIQELIENLKETSDLDSFKERICYAMPSGNSPCINMGIVYEYEQTHSLYLFLGHK